MHETKAAKFFAYVSAARRPTTRKLASAASPAYVPPYGKQPFPAACPLSRANATASSIMDIMLRPTTSFTAMP